MPTTTDELYEVAAEAMLSRASRKVSKEASALLQRFLRHAEQQRITGRPSPFGGEGLGKNSSEKKMKAAMGELKSLVLDDQLPLVRLMSKRAEPLQMQAFHLSFQEFYAMRELCAGAPLERTFDWSSAWWTNAVLMGVQIDNLQEQEERAGRSEQEDGTSTATAFGANFAKAAKLSAAPSSQGRRGVRLRSSRR